MGEDFNYYRAEFGRVLTGNVDATSYRLKVTSGAGETRWLSISAEQVEAIRDLLAHEPQDARNCADCGFDLSEVAGVMVFKADGHGGVKPVKTADDKNAMRCLECENHVQHPNEPARHYVTRDGKRVSPMFEDENDTFKWLMKHQGMSTDWATKYEGYGYGTTGPDTQPMKPGEMGKYVCVGGSGCLHSPQITIKSDGVWVRERPGGPVSSSHRDCFEARRARKDS